MAAWALLGGLFVVFLLHLGPGLWEGGRGTLIIGGLIAAVVVFNVIRARTRTVRPRYYHLAESLSALWLGVGAGIAVQTLGEEGGVDLGTAVQAASVLVLPMLACSLWLRARGR